MRNFTKKSNKKLSMLVGMALGTGIVFGMLPADAAEAANWTVTKNGDSKYNIVNDAGYSKQSMSYFEFKDEIVNIAGQANEHIYMSGTNVGQAVSDIPLVLGANTVVTVEGTTNKAKVVASSESTPITVTGSGISGDNVNLKSVEVSVKGGKNATFNVTGHIDSITVTADEGKTGALIFEQPVSVGTLTVADNTALTTSATGVKVDTLVLDNGAVVSGNTKVAVNKIVVDASDAQASAQLANLDVSALGSEGKVAIEVLNPTEENKVIIDSAVTAINSGGKVTADTTVTTELKPDDVTSVKEQVESAFETSDKVVLDKDQAKQLTGVTVPGGKTLEVNDGEGGTVSATPKGDAVLNYASSTLNADDGTAFASVVVDTKKVVKVDIPNAVIDNAVINGVLDTNDNDVQVGNLSVTGGEIAAGKGTIKADTAKFSGGAVNAANVNVAGVLTVESGANVVAAVTAKDAYIAGNVAGNVSAANATIHGTVTGAVEAQVVTLEGFVNGTITTEKIIVDDISRLNAGQVVAPSGGKVTLVNNSSAALTDEDIAKVFGEGTAITVTDKDGNPVKELIGTGGKEPIGPSGPSDEEVKAAKDEAAEKIGAADEALKAVGGENLSADRPEKVAAMNPFKDQVPTAAEIGVVASANKDGLKVARTELVNAQKTLVGLGLGSGTEDYDAIQKKIDELDKFLADDFDFKAQAAELTAAVQQVGKTAAAPSATSARTAGVITSVMTQNVVTRTAEIRGFASAIDEGRPAPEKVWFQYKHTNMDVDGGDVYSKSTINTNNFQLGYDTQIGTNDYLGAYIGTTTGNADFRGPARDGRVDIENAFDFGVYGTHMLPNDQYIDYMIHTGKFDSKLSDVKYGTNDTGLMVGYGLKLAQTENLTLNPYVQLAYDKVDVDSYTIAGNTVNSDKSNNWTAKLGLNLIDASGFYGGLAYSRGLSGSYNAYLNGVPMPTQDNNANVIYLSMGYRAMMSKNALLDLSMEKTFADYKGWTAAGKINFYF